MTDAVSAEVLDTFSKFFGSAWNMAEAGHYKTALESYKIAEQVNPFGDGTIGPGPSILRHVKGKSNGVCVKAVTPTEDKVVFLSVMVPHLELPGYANRPMPKIDGEQLEKNIRLFLDWPFDAGHHGENITEDREHIFTLSAGRSGTMSLMHLLKDSNLEPHHAYWWQIIADGMWWMLAAVLEGNRKAFQEVATHWMPSRAAEWLGPKPMWGLNHMDTIFAPVFSNLHKKSKFVYLNRNSEDVFKSIYGKNQFHMNQLMPFVWSLADGFIIHHLDLELWDRIAWFIKFTEEFSRAFGRAIGPDRFLEISAEKLFSQDREEIRKLLDFTNSDVSVYAAMEHYKTKINEKKHKAIVPLEPGLTEFREVFINL